MFRPLRAVPLAALAVSLVLSVAPVADAAGTAGTAGTAGLRLPAPTGPYPVGTATLHLVDLARADPWVPSRPRELMVGMYYPARSAAGVPARYAMTEEARLLIEAQGLRDVVSPETLGGTATNGRVGTPPATGRFPLVVLSPGMGAPRYTMTTLAEDLASRGYVVAAVDHAYESVGTAFPGGRMLTCVACERAQTTEDLRALTVGRGRDVSFLLDRLTHGRPGWRHAAMIDRRRVGMAGHSIGGASAVPAMVQDRRILAGANLDGAFHYVPAAGLGRRPFMMLGTDDEVHRPGGTDRTWDATYPHLDGWRRWLVVAGATHFGFTDFATLAEQLGRPQPALPGSRSVAITRTYVAAFVDLHLRGVPQPRLDGPAPDVPEVRRAAE